MKSLIFLLAWLLAAPAGAATSPDGSIQAAVQAAMEASASSLILPQAIMWLGSFMALQFVITNLGLLKSGADIEAISGKLVGSLAWFGVCVYILQNGPDFIDSVGTGILRKFMPDWISPGYILASIGGVIGLLLSTIGLTGLMALGNGSPMLALVVIIVLLVVVGVALGLAAKIFMLKLELGLVVMLSPLSFAFLGLNALKDQGIAPFKALISLVYRAVLLGVICAAFKEVSTTTEAALAAIDFGMDITTWYEKAQIMISSVFAYPMLGYLVWKSDSIAASLASGSTNMGTADVAGAVAAGVAAGGVASAAAGALGATKPLQSMANFMKNLGGGGGTQVTNGGGMGSGGGRSGSPADAMPMASIGDAPVPPATPPSPFTTGSKGQPLPSISTPHTGGANGNAADRSPVAASSEKTGDFAAALSAQSSGAPVAPVSPAYAAGSSQSAGISAGGAGDMSSLAKTLESIDSHLSPKKPGVIDKLKDVNQHVVQEKAATHVSINTHHAD